MDRQDLTLMVIVGVLVVGLIGVNVLASSIVTEQGTSALKEVTEFMIPQPKPVGAARTILVVDNPFSVTTTTVNVGGGN